MRRQGTAAALSLAFIAGCIIAQVAPKFVVPPVLAGTDPVKWEYQCIHLGAVREQDQLQVKANQLGAQGWEMVGGAGVGVESLALESWCFKRALP